jgi:hypothetical protein
MNVTQQKKKRRRTAALHMPATSITSDINITSDSKSPQAVPVLAAADIFDQEKIYCCSPMSHWAMVIVFIQRKEVYFLTLCRGSAIKFLWHILHWLMDQQALQNDSTEPDTSDSAELEVPQQSNGSTSADQITFPSTAMPMLCLYALSLKYLPIQVLYI